MSLGEESFPPLSKLRRQKTMIIDIHTHLGRVTREDIPVTVEELIENMDKWEVEKAVVLPLDATPEGSTF